MNIGIEIEDMELEPQSLLNWLEAVSRGMAKAKRMPPPKTFLFDKPVPPRYKVWQRRPVSGIHFPDPDVG